jgi:hypothetical protein
MALWGQDLWGASVWGGNLCPPEPEPPEPTNPNAPLWGIAMWGTSLWGGTGPCEPEPCPSSDGPPLAVLKSLQPLEQWNDLVSGHLPVPVVDPPITLGPKLTWEPARTQPRPKRPAEPFPEDTDDEDELVLLGAL